MATTKLAASLLVALLVPGFSAESRCPSNDAMGSAVCEEVHAEFEDQDMNPSAVALMQVESTRVVDGRNVRVAPAREAVNTDLVTATPQEAKMLQAQANISSASGDAQIPGFGDIINSVGDAASQAANQVVGGITDVANNAYGAATDAVTNITGTASTAAAVQVATALNETMLSLDSQAVQWRKECYGLLDKMVNGMDAAFNDSEALLTTFEKNVDSTVGGFLPFWNNISAAIRLTTNLAGGVLKTLGQDSYVKMLNESVSLAMQKTGAVVRSLTNATQLIKGISKKAKDEAAMQLLRMNATLEEALDSIEEYADQLEVAFEDLTDQAAAGLESTVVGVNAKQVDKAFGGVRKTASRVVRDIFNGPAAIVTALTEANTKVVASVGGTRSAAARTFSFTMMMLAPLVVLTTSA